MCHPFHHFIKKIGMLGHSVELFLGKYFFVLAGEWCWHPLWTAILLVHTASSTFYQHSLNVFDFLSYHQIETALSTDNFCFCDHQPFTVILKCARTTEWTTFPVKLYLLTRIIFLRYFLETFIISNLSIFPVIFVTWQSVVFHSHCISAVLTFKSYTCDSERSNNGVF